ncbi:MAG TPA: RnfABCDGE type electron transport complex subunit G [Gammaproteobacteria bacterium]|nr:RnfABCDGE type electron transport complex subunit G [Gammaproteobacteria bacterium]
MIERARLSAALVFTLAAALAGGLVSVSYEISHDRIATNQRDRILTSLRDVLGATRFDNGVDVSATLLDAIIRRSGNEPLAIFAATHDGVPVATVFAVAAPHGYNGPIELLVGVASDGTVTGVRVLAHRETPGLGDAIEHGKSDWIDGFVGTRLGEPPVGAWKVTKDGGHFDALTGATVTPRAIVDAVRATLLFDRNRGVGPDTALPPGQADGGR